LDLEFDIQAFDGDGDPTGTSTLSVTVDAEDAAPFAAMMVNDEGANDNSSMSLLSSDDQQQYQQQKTAANTNTTLLAAAVAAAGVGGKAAAQDAKAHKQADDAEAGVVSAVASAEQGSVAGGSEAPGSALTGETQEAAGDASNKAAKSADNAGDEPAGGHSLTAANDSDPVTQPVQLLEATEMSAGQGAESIVAPTVSMPSAEALIAASLKGGESEGSKENAVVGKVLLDALEGGGTEQSVDALLEALPAPANGENAAAEALASQPVAAVPAWDTGHIGQFTNAANFTMEAMALHHDAVQPVANG